MSSFKIKGSSTFNVNGPIRTFNNTTTVTNTGNITKYYYYTGQEVEVDLQDFDTISISAVAGGGAGGSKTILLGTYYSGGGGGSGGSITNLPLTVNHSLDDKIILYVGRGGRTAGEDGENTYIKINGVQYSMFAGKGSQNSTAGEGGYGNVTGQRGIDGSISLPSMPVIQGGAGADSFIGIGGGSVSVKQPRIYVPPIPTYGGGGKGMAIDSDTAEPGQDGIIYITFFPKLS